MTDPILFETTSGVATITLNRPDKLNALSAELVTRLVEALEECRVSDAVKVIVVTGAGRAFSSGGDRSRFESASASTPAEMKAAIVDNIQRLPRKFEEIDKPTIASINGVAVGAGLDIALMCDIRFAAESARLGEAYARVGLIPGAGGAYFLPRLIGPAKALELLWTGDNIDAREAERIGLVNCVFADDDLPAKTREFAERLVNTSPLAVRLIKRVMYQSLECDLRTSLDLVASNMPLVRGSEDHVEAVNALREKRAPAFKGR